ncbi:MAG: hypothetical protein U1E60_08940 [Reyranellaceae bacterium]
MALAGQGELDAAVESFDRARVLDPGSLRYARLSKLWLPIIPASSSALAAQRVRYRDGIDALQQFGPLPPPETINLPSAFLAYPQCRRSGRSACLCRLYRTASARSFASGTVHQHWRAPMAGVSACFLSEFLGDHTIGRLYGGPQPTPRSKPFRGCCHPCAARFRGYHVDQFDRLADKAIRLPTTLGQRQQAVAAESLDLLFYPDIGARQGHLPARPCAAGADPGRELGTSVDDRTGHDRQLLRLGSDSIET